MLYNARFYYIEMQAQQPAKVVILYILIYNGMHIIACKYTLLIFVQLNFMPTGTVKFFNIKNKFGFIIEDESRKEFYVHAKGCLEEIKEGDRVEFELKPAKRGDECVQVKKIAAATN